MSPEPIPYLGTARAFADLDPLIRAMIDRLPPTGSTWPANDRRIWLVAFATVLDLVYSEVQQP